MKTPQKIINETRLAAEICEQCGDKIHESIEVGNILYTDRDKLDKMVSSLYGLALDLRISLADMEIENDKVMLSQ
jgi:hypothetical protein